MKYKKPLINSIIILLIFFPFSFWVIWELAPQKKLQVLIMDKSSVKSNGIEHRAFNRILINNKYVKTNNENYSVTEDYFGFFPSEKIKYKIKDLKNYYEKQLDSIANLYDVAYYTDTYGINYEEWLNTKQKTKYSQKLYGGLDEKDLLFLKKMKEKRKLIIAEFNFFAKPTTNEIRSDAEKLLGLNWTGWTGRYFKMLDTIKNSELPRWLVTLYKEQNKGKWPFKKSGIVFVKDDETITILENETDLLCESPQIFTSKYGQNKFSVPYKINYSYWFDITYPIDTSHKIISYYKINTNKKGDSILYYYKIPRVFPAVLESKDNLFYYFCGDFCDIPVSNFFAKFKYISYLKSIFQNEKNLNNRLPFFFKYYEPLVKKILYDYYSAK